MKSGEGLYMGLILVWAGPFVLLLWYDLMILSSHSAANVLQESCISIYHGIALFKHSSTHPLTYSLPLDCGHLSIETRDVGHRVRNQNRVASLGRTGD